MKSKKNKMFIGNVIVCWCLIRLVKLIQINSVLYKIWLHKQKLEITHIKQKIIFIKVNVLK